MQILHQGQLRGAPVIGLNHPDGYFRQPRHPGGAPAPLSGDDLIIAGVQLADGNGLDQAVLGDGVCQLLQSILIKIFSGLFQPGLHLTDGQMQQFRFRLVKITAAEERVQADAQTLVVFCCHLFPHFSLLAINSTARAI